MLKSPAACFPKFISGVGWQAVSKSGPIAGLTARSEFSAGRGAPLVDAARCMLADLARQCGAARRPVVGAAHAAQLLGDGVGQACWHAASAAFEFLHGKVHAKAGATGAAGQARVCHGQFWRSVEHALERIAKGQKSGRSRCVFG